jgi:hypothetical protein
MKRNKAKPFPPSADDYIKIDMSAFFEGAKTCATEDVEDEARRQIILQALDYGQLLSKITPAEIDQQAADILTQRDFGGNN